MYANGTFKNPFTDFDFTSLRVRSPAFTAPVASRPCNTSSRAPRPPSPHRS